MKLDKKDKFILEDDDGNLLFITEIDFNFNMLQNRMDIIEFAENYLKLELAEYQKEILLAYYNHGPNNNFIYTPIRSGKTLIAKIITEYERAAYDMK